MTDVRANGFTVLKELKTREFKMITVSTSAVFHILQHDWSELFVVTVLLSLELVAHIMFKYGSVILLSSCSCIRCCCTLFGCYQKIKNNKHIDCSAVLLKY